MGRSHHIPPAHNMTDKELLFSIFRSEEHLSLAMIPQMFKHPLQGDITTSELQPYLILCGCILWENSTLMVTGSGIKDLNAPETINASEASIVPEN